MATSLHLQSMTQRLTEGGEQVSRKKTVASVTAILAIILMTVMLGSCGSSEDQDSTKGGTEGETYTFTMATPWEASHPTAVPAVDFAQFVSENCVTEDGKVVIEREFGPETIAGKEQLGALKTGTVDVAEIVTDYAQGEIPAFKILLAPGVWTYSNWAQLWNEGVKDIIADALDEQGLVLLGAVAPMHKWVWMTESFDSLSDLKGKVIRGTGRPITDFISYVGAQPDSLASSEVYTGLERGVIDGSMQGFTSYTQYGMWDVAPYVLDYEFNALLGVVVMNKSKFESLPVSLQEKLMEMDSLFQEQVTSYWIDVRDSAVEESKANGATFITVPASEIQDMDAYMNEVYSDAVTEDIPEVQAAFDVVLGKVK